MGIVPLKFGRTGVWKTTCHGRGDGFLSWPCVTLGNGSSLEQSRRKIGIALIWMPGISRFHSMSEICGEMGPLALICWFQSSTRTVLGISTACCLAFLRIRSAPLGRTNIFPWRCFGKSEAEQMFVNGLGIVSGMVFAAWNLFGIRTVPPLTSQSTSPKALEVGKE